MNRMRLLGIVVFSCVCMVLPLLAEEALPQTARIKDITTIEGIRDNPLVGYGMVVGLNGTGDRRQTVFTTQMLFNILQRMGIQIPASAVRVDNIAAVFVTATLPPFSHPGMRIDVTASSIGDAKSLEGGLLLLTPLHGPDGQVYAAAQGPLTLGGYSAGGAGATRQVNHPTVGRVPAGAIVERQLSVDLKQLPRLSFLLRESDFATAHNLAEAINRETGKPMAKPLDGRSVEILPNFIDGEELPGLLARIQNLEVLVQRSAKVVVNERTGTVVLGSEVTLGAVSILHGSLTIDIATDLGVSQPPPFSQGDTVVVPQSEIIAKESPAQRVELPAGATVETLVRGLQTIGATARDIVAILQAIKAAGALQAELEII